MKNKLKIVALIPARYDSKRFPGKLMKDLGGKTVIRRTYEATKATELFEAVYVVTDSSKIYDEITTHGGAAMYSKTAHNTGSDRIAEAAAHLETDIVVNVQGDEPFVNKGLLENLLNVFKNDHQQVIALASPMTPLKEWDEIKNPNHVKVITDANRFALYFSRSVIPYPQEKNTQTTYFKHIGIYAFRKKPLMEFTKLAVKPLEAAEKIECLRFLEHGKRIKMIETHARNIGIDTPEDLEKARIKINKN